VTRPRSEIAERHRNLAARFTSCASAVPDDAWERPAPCEGWVARDVVRHLVEWLPGFFFTAWELDAPPVPSVEDDPVGAWAVVRDVFQRALDDPAVAARVRPSPAGERSLDDAVGMFYLPDLLIHTWDLARATGIDEQLDADEVRGSLLGMEQMDPAMDAAMRDSGHYGPRVEVGPDADEQTRLLAFVGRDARR
jgi:uncharacterized protein (TIGR03086 family)